MALGGPSIYPGNVNFPGSWRNQERTGQRYVSKLSAVARRIEGVRHTDIDLTQWCPKCKRPQLFAEVKKIPVSNAEWDQARRHAAFYKCMAILVIEPPGDQVGVRVFTSGDGLISDMHWGDEEYLEGILKVARECHSCW